MMFRPSPVVVVVAVSLLGTACGGTGSPTVDDTQVSSEEAQALRQDMLDAGIVPVTEAPPAVSHELFELGQALFFDEILSGNEDVSCATCHLPQFATGDGRTLSNGVHGFGLGPNRDGGVMLPRNSPPLFNLHLREELFWDGRVGHMENPFGPDIRLPPAVFVPADMETAFTPGLELMAAQAMLPPVSREEMRGMAGDNDLGDLGDGYGSINGNPFATFFIWEQLNNRVQNLPRYQRLFQAAYPDVAIQDFSFSHAGNAIAAFEAQAFARSDSPFNRFLLGDDAALTPRQVRGAHEFLAAGCAQCHTGPLLTNDSFHNTGLPQLGPGTLVSGVQLPGGRPDLGRAGVTNDFRDTFKFRTASLLNVELTGPYGHAGQFERLRDFVAHYQDPVLSNANYDLQSNVHDPDLIGMLVPNSIQVLASLDPLLEDPNDFDVDAVVDFLLALTADDARSLDDVVPESVPSGRPIVEHELR